MLPVKIQFGSQVYGTANKNVSDFDYIVVGAESDAQQIRYISIVDEEHVTTQTFQKMLDDHKIKALEVYFTAEQELKSSGFVFNLDLAKLRVEISSVASNSWVKAKKKIEVEHDYYCGQKSLFHALRILMFGIQIAKTGKINDFGCANEYYGDIVKYANQSWQPLKEKYQPIYNSLSTKFKKLAPK